MTGNEALVPDRPAGGGWEESVKELAFQAWCWAGKQSGTATEFVLMREAMAATPDGQEPPPVPSASTINLWAREGGWRMRFYARLAEGDYQVEEVAAEVQAWQIGRGGMETMAQAQAGVFDHNPGLLAAKMKEIELAVRLAGAGTYGNQFGGGIKVRIEKLLTEEQLALEAETLTPMERSRQLREETIEDNRATKR